MVNNNKDLKRYGGLTNKTQAFAKMQEMATALQKAKATSIPIIFAQHGKDKAESMLKKPDNQVIVYRNKKFYLLYKGPNQKNTGQQGVNQQDTKQIELFLSGTTIKAKKEIESSCFSTQKIKLPFKDGKFDTSDFLESKKKIKEKKGAAPFEVVGEIVDTPATTTRVIDHVVHTTNFQALDIKVSTVNTEQITKELSGKSKNLSLFKHLDKSSTNAFESGTTPSLRHAKNYIDGLSEESEKEKAINDVKKAILGAVQKQIKDAPKELKTFLTNEQIKTLKEAKSLDNLVKQLTTEKTLPLLKTINTLLGKVGAENVNEAIEKTKQNVVDQKNLRKIVDTFLKNEAISTKLKTGLETLKDKLDPRKDADVASTLNELMALVYKNMDASILKIDMPGIDPNGNKGIETALNNAKTTFNEHMAQCKELLESQKAHKATLFSEQLRPKEIDGKKVPGTVSALLGNENAETWIAVACFEKGASAEEETPPVTPKIVYYQVDQNGIVSLKTKEKLEEEQTTLKTPNVLALSRQENGEKTAKEMATASLERLCSDRSTVEGNVKQGQIATLKYDKKKKVFTFRTGNLTPKTWTQSIKGSGKLLQKKSKFEINKHGEIKITSGKLKDTSNTNIHTILPEGTTGTTDKGSTKTIPTVKNTLETLFGKENPASPEGTRTDAANATFTISDPMPASPIAATIPTTPAQEGLTEKEINALTKEGVQELLETEPGENIERLEKRLKQLNLELITEILNEIKDHNSIFTNEEEITAFINQNLTVEHLKNIEKVLDKHYFDLEVIEGFDDEKIFTNTFKNLEAKKEVLELEFLHAKLDSLNDEFKGADSLEQILNIIATKLTVEDLDKIDEALFSWAKLEIQGNLKIVSTKTTNSIKEALEAKQKELELELEFLHDKLDDINDEFKEADSLEQILNTIATKLTVEDLDTIDDVLFSWAKLEIQGNLKIVSTKTTNSIKYALEAKQKELELEFLHAKLDDINDEFKGADSLEQILNTIATKLTVEDLDNINKALESEEIWETSESFGFENTEPQKLKSIKTVKETLEAKQNELKLERVATEASDTLDEALRNSGAVTTSDLAAVTTSDTATTAIEAVNTSWDSYKKGYLIPQDKKKVFDLFTDNNLSTARKDFLLDQFEAVNVGTFLTDNTDKTQNLIRLLQLLNYSSYNTLAEDLSDEITGIISDIIANSTEMKDVAKIMTLLNDIAGKEEFEMKVQEESGTDTGTVTDGLLSEALRKTQVLRNDSFVEKFRRYVSKCFNDTKKEDPLLAFARKYELGISTTFELEKGIKVKDIDDMQFFENLGYSKAQITERYLYSIDISPDSASDSIIETLTAFGVAKKQDFSASKFAEIVRQKGSYETKIGRTPSMGPTSTYQFGTEVEPLTEKAALRLQAIFQHDKDTKIFFSSTGLSRTVLTQTNGNEWTNPNSTDV